MRRSCRRLGPTLLLLLCAAGVALGQGTASAVPEILPDALQARLTELEASANLGEEEKARALEALEQAVQQTRALENWRARLEEYQAAIDAAPARLAALRESLADPAPLATPEITLHPTLAENEHALAQAESALARVRQTVQELESESRQRTARRSELPNLIAQARDRLEEARAAQPPTEGPPELIEARRLLIKARHRAVEAELAALEHELLSYDARGELLAARRESAQRDLVLATQMAEVWRGALSEQRRLQATQDARAAQEARIEAATEHAVIRELANANAALAQLRTGADGLVASLERAEADMQRRQSELAKIRTRMDSTQDRLQVAGLTHAVSVLLRRQREELPDSGQIRRQIRQRRAQITDVQLQLIEYEDKRLEVARIDEQLDAMLASLDPAPDQATLETLAPRVRDLLRQRRDFVNALATDYNRFLTLLVDLDSVEHQLITEVEAYRWYIDEHVLWIRSANLLGYKDARHALAGLHWLLDGGAWLETTQVLARDARDDPGPYVLLTIVLVAVLWSRRVVRHRLDAIGARVRAQGLTSRYGETIDALICTILLAAVWPAVMLLLSWRLGMSLEATPHSRAAAAGLPPAAFSLLTLTFLYHLLRTNGLADIHFRWRREHFLPARRNMLWLIPIVVTSFFVVAALESRGSQEHSDGLGRVLLVVGLIAVSVFTRRAFGLLGRNPKTGERRVLRGTFLSMHHIWYPIMLAFPLVLAGMAVYGYYYTALRLTKHFDLSIWLVFGLVILNATVQRWLLIARYRLALKNKEEEEREEAEADAISEERPFLIDDDDEISLTDINNQTMALLRTALTITLAGGLWYIWRDMLPALRFLDQVPLSEHVSLMNVVLSLVIVVLTIVLGRNIPGLLEITILRYLPMDKGARYAAISVIRYMIGVVGIVLAFGFLGVAWNDVQWLVAAMTVGLGFGLQEIFANFVSGLIIFFERPIRVGDIVTIGETSGTVTKIRIRATTITDWDRKELIVPNREFITGNLINWTLSDMVSRVQLRIGVAYGSDLDKVEEILLRIARAHPDALEDPPPRVVFMGFGDSSLDYLLNVMVPSVDVRFPVLHALNRAVDREFRAAGVEIPFPQRDLHVRSGLPPAAPEADNE